MIRAGVEERGVAGGVQGGCGVFFQIYSKSNLNHLPVVDSPKSCGDGVL